MNASAISHRTALVVEDEEQIAYLLRFILEREGYKVELASDGQVAQDRILNGAPPVLVVLDVMLGTEPVAHLFHGAFDCPTAL